jgi:hypothetical protein
LVTLTELFQLLIGDESDIMLEDPELGRWAASRDELISFVAVLEAIS